MMKKKHISTAVLVAMASVMALTGCSKKDDSKETTTTTQNNSSNQNNGEYTPATCTLSVDWWGGDSRHNATNAALDAFTAKYTQISIPSDKRTYAAWSDWETAKALQYKNNAMPDLQQTNFDWIGKYQETNDCKLYYDLYQAKDVLDLTQYDESILKMCEDSKGQLAGLPVSLTGRTFYWNKATFEKAGIAVPESLADLKNAGAVFKDKLGDEYYPLVIGQYDRAILVAFYEQAKTGTSIINEKGEFTLTQDQLKDGLDMIKSLEECHAIPTIEYMDGEGAESMDKSARFINGMYAGIFEWDSSPKKYVTALGDNGSNLVVGQEFKDLGDKASGVYVKVSLMFSVSASSKNPKEAAFLLNYLMNDAEGAKLMSAERGIPESKAGYKACEAAGALYALSAEAHNVVMGSNPMYWNPLFDNSKLKGTDGAYNTVYANVSYGKDEFGDKYTTENGAKDLFEAYKSVCK